VGSNLSTDRLKLDVAAGMLPDQRHCIYPESISFVTTAGVAGQFCLFLFHDWGFIAHMSEVDDYVWAIQGIVKCEGGHTIGAFLTTRSAGIG
jgi:hypothetical protein